MLVRHGDHAESILGRRKNFSFNLGGMGFWGSFSFHLLGGRNETEEEGLSCEGYSLYSRVREWAERAFLVRKTHGRKPRESELILRGGSCWYFLIPGRKESVWRRAHLARRGDFQVWSLWSSCSSFLCCFNLFSFSADFLAICKSPSTMSTMSRRSTVGYSARNPLLQTFHALLHQLQFYKHK